MNRNISAAALAVMFSPALIAQGPDRSLVPANAAFVVHVDLQKVADVLGLDAVLDNLSDSDSRELRDVLRRMDDRLGFDPREDLRSVTIFGTDLSGRTPGVVFTTTEALDDALDALADEGGLEVDRYRGLRFQRILARGLADALRIDDVDVGDESLTIYVKRLRGNRRAVLVGERPEQILDAARVFEDEDLSLAEARDADLSLRPSSGSMVYVEATNSMEELLGESPASMLGDKVRGLALDVSEEQNTVGIRLMVATASRRDARDVEAMINGLRGLISLAQGLEDMDEIPELVRGILDELEAEADGNRVTVSLSLPLREIRQMLEQAMRNY